MINEVQYNPPQSGPDASFEWLEVVNRVTETTILNGWSISDNRGSDSIPPLVLPPNGLAVIAATEEGFRSNFSDFDGNVVFVEDGAIGNGLNNEGDRLILEDGTGRVISALSYGDDSSCSPHCWGVPEGHSLERLPAGGDEFVDNPDPTPGRGLAPPSTPTPAPTCSPAPTPTHVPTAMPLPTAVSVPTDSATVSPTETPTGAPSSGSSGLLLGVLGIVAAVVAVAAAAVLLFRKWRGRS